MGENLNRVALPQENNEWLHVMCAHRIHAMLEAGLLHVGLTKSLWYVYLHYFHLTQRDGVSACLNTSPNGTWLVRQISQRRPQSPRFPPLQPPVHQHNYTHAVSGYRWPLFSPPLACLFRKKWLLLPIFCIQGMKTKACGQNHKGAFWRDARVKVPVWTEVLVDQGRGPVGGWGWGGQPWSSPCPGGKAFMPASLTWHSSEHTLAGKVGKVASVLWHHLP